MPMVTLALPSPEGRAPLGSHGTVVLGDTQSLLGKTGPPMLGSCLSPLEILSLNVSPAS